LEEQYKRLNKYDFYHINLMTLRTIQYGGMKILLFDFSYLDRERMFFAVFERRQF